MPEKQQLHFKIYFMLLLSDRLRWIRGIKLLYIPTYRNSITYKLYINILFFLDRSKNWQILLLPRVFWSPVKLLTCFYAILLVKNLKFGLLQLREVDYLFDVAIVSRQALIAATNGDTGFFLFQCSVKILFPG